MTETVILAIIGGVVTILTAIIGKLSVDVGRTKKDAKSAATDAKSAAADAKEARVQVKNNHDTNLREEGDERHDEQMTALKELARDVRGLREDHYETRKDIGMLHAEDRAGRRETQALRQEFAEHIQQTAPLIPTLEALQRNLNHKD